LSEYNNSQGDAGNFAKKTKKRAQPFVFSPLFFFLVKKEKSFKKKVDHSFYMIRIRATNKVSAEKRVTLGG